MLLHFKSILFLIGTLCTTQLLAQCPNSYNIVVNNRPNCLTANNGQLGLSSTTYYANSTYLWSNGATTASNNGLLPGNYSVTVTDPTQCSYSASIYLPITNSPGATVSQGSCNNISVSGFNGLNTQYAWSNGATTRNISPPPGNYSVTLTDSYGCTASTNYVHTNPVSALTLTSTVTNATCGDNGAIDLTVSGGVAPYYYYWDYNYARTQDLNNIPSGDYIVYVSDSTGCSSTLNVTVGGNRIDLQTFNTSCGNNNNGQITVVAPWLSSPTYLWNNGATTATISGLSYGPYYSVTITDGACTYIRTDSLDYNFNRTLSVETYVDSTICGTVDSIISYVFYSSGSHSYLWNTGATTRNIPLSPTPTNYSVTVTENIGGCIAVDTILGAAIVTNLSINGVITDATCGNNDGAIDLTITGSSQGYTTIWQPNGETTEDLNNIYAGRYIVSINNFGCITTDTFEVGEFIELNHTPASCSLANGTATVREFGMTTPTFLWSNGATTRTTNNLAAGDYYITVTNGACVLIDTISITDGGTVNSIITLSAPCLPDDIVASSIGGASPFSILWNTGSTDHFINTPTPGATYAVTITDANGCSDNASILIPNPPALSATSIVTNASCGNKNGAIDVTVVGGTPPFNYSWSHFNANIEDLSGIYPGQYRNRITDNAGCVVDITSNVSGQISTYLTGTTTPPNSSNTGGSIDLTLHNGTASSYLWNTGATTEDISGLSSGIYTVSVTEIGGCVLARSFRLNMGPVPSATICGRIYDITATQTCQRQGALPLTYRQVTLMPGNITVFTDVHGRYKFTVTTPGSYTVSLSGNSIANFSCPATSTIVHNNVLLNNSYCTDHFVTNPPFQDLRLDLHDYSRASPGFPYYTRINYCNDGNTTMSGTIDYDYDPLLGFQSITGRNSTLFLHNIGAHTFNWSFSNLLPAECRTIDVRFTVPASTPLGTPLIGTANIYPQSGDATPANNTDQIGTTVVGSYDPNDKQVSPYHTGNAWDGGTIYQADEELEYMIRFQNTGTAPAQFVIIRDTLDVNLIPSTIRYIDTKHDVDIRIEDGNILIATFDNIYLPDSSVNFEASIGFIKFTINRQPNLPIGTSIENTAAIYFDFNAPIITNTPVSTIGTITSHLVITDNQIDVQTMPNPFQEHITVQYQLEEEENITIQIHNSLGQVVKTYTKNQTQQAGAHIETINTKSLPAAMYLLVLSTDDKIITKRIIKQ